jgi:hypothetical protein
MYLLPMVLMSLLVGTWSLLRLSSYAYLHEMHWSGRKSQKFAEGELASCHIKQWKQQMTTRLC